MEMTAQQVSTWRSPQSFIDQSHIKSLADYEKMYQQSIDPASSFWLDQAATLDWFQKPTTACQYQWDIQKRQIDHNWFHDGVLNVSYNCLDRHLENRAQKTALIWQELFLQGCFF